MIDGKINKDVTCFTIFNTLQHKQILYTYTEHIISGVNVVSVLYLDNTYLVHCNIQLRLYTTLHAISDEIIYHT